MRGPPAAVQALAIRDEQRLTGGVVRANRHRSRDIGGAVARDHDGRQTRGGRRAQPGCGTRDASAFSAGIPSSHRAFWWASRSGIGFFTSSAFTTVSTRPSPTSCRISGSAQLPGAVCHHAHPDACGERVHHEVDEAGSRRQVGVADQLLEHHGLGHVDLVGKQLGQHIAFRGDAALA